MPVPTPSVNPIDQCTDTVVVTDAVQGATLTLIVNGAPLASFNVDRLLTGWGFAGNTAGFGNLGDGKHPAWLGDFTTAGREQVLFYYAGDGSWWLGTHDGNQLRWALAGNTSGARAGDPNFGNLTRPGIRFWTGDFSGAQRQQVLFYNAGDGNRWLGTHDGSQLRWALAGNTSGSRAGDPNFGNLTRPGVVFWTSDFSGAKREEVVFYNAGDGNWWLGTHDSGGMRWVLAGNTSGARPGDPNFGNLTRGT